MGDRISGAGACAPFARRTVPLDVRVLPEAGETPIVEVLERARRSIRVMSFQIGPSRVLDALGQKIHEGVRVRLILDGSPLSHNESHLALVRKARINVREGHPRFEYTHAKTIVVDDEVAIISTGNFVGEQNQSSRNFLAIDRDPEDVAALAEIFDADWDRAAADRHCDRLVISPDNARHRIVKLIESAKTTLDVETMELADNEVRAALAARRKAGVRVRVVLADPYWIAANERAAEYLAAHGVHARYLVSPSVHAKAIVADGRVAFIGSVNFSYTSLNRNREVGVLVDEAPGIATIAATLARDWSASIPFTLPHHAPA